MGKGRSGNDLAPYLAQPLVSVSVPAEPRVSVVHLGQIPKQLGETAARSLSERDKRHVIGLFPGT